MYFIALLSAGAAHQGRRSHRPVPDSHRPSTKAEPVLVGVRYRSVNRANLGSIDATTGGLVTGFEARAPTRQPPSTGSPVWSRCGVPRS
jgi:hypothetical protein